MRSAVVVLAIAAAALTAAPPLAAKDGVRATLITPFPVAAASGDRIDVTWRLRYVTEGGGSRPFGANGVFVRLPSVTGARAETGWAPSGSHESGVYRASVVVPKGWIGEVEIGLRGFTSGARGSRTADVLFSITNDPPLRPAIDRQASADSRRWPFALAGLLLLLTVPVVLLRRRVTSAVSDTEPVSDTERTAGQA
ncbi:MAG TPA: hypothetical protein VFL41_11190 [Gaiellaceae bacterium]|nr:hypothetical protein [Gaiellaceae bacterium]